MARSEAPASAKAAGNSYPLRLPPPRQSSTLPYAGLDQSATCRSSGPAPAATDERGVCGMTRNVSSQIGELIAAGEGATMEFKRSLTKDVGRTLCAFANAGGGTVLIGVSDAGEAVGVANHNRLKARVLSTAARRICPSGWRSRVSAPCCASSCRRRIASRTRSGDGSSCATGRAAGRCRTRRWKTCSTRPDACTSTRCRARTSPSSAISMTRPGRGSAAVPRSRRPWTAWWRSGISASSTTTTG